MKHLKFLMTALFVAFVLTGCAGNKTAPSGNEGVLQDSIIQNSVPDDNGSLETGVDIDSEMPGEGDSDVQTSELNSSDSESEAEPETDNSDSESETEPETDSPDSAQDENRILIAYFSRADENYGVGVVEKGNTEVIAEMIAEETGGELFHIERDTPYPSEYRKCTDEAKQEQNDNARPALLSDHSIDEYDVIFLGYAGGIIGLN